MVTARTGHASPAAGGARLGRMPTRTVERMSPIDTGTEDLLASVDDGVATLTMNRPDRRNAMSGAMNQALARCWRRSKWPTMWGAWC